MTWAPASSRRDRVEKCSLAAGFTRFPTAIDSPATLVSRGIEPVRVSPPTGQIDCAGGARVIPPLPRGLIRTENFRYAASQRPPEIGCSGNRHNLERLSGE